MSRKPETNFTHCTRACPRGEHKHYVTGGYTYVKYSLTLERHRCNNNGTHFHRVETVEPATLLQRLIPSRRVGHL